MRLLPGLVSVLVEQVYSIGAPVSLIIRRKDHTGMIHITAYYEDETMFEDLLDTAKHKFKE